MARDLTKEKVVATAAELANELGDIQQLKLKDVAARLKIKVPSLYNHVKGLDGLVHALRVHALRILEEELRNVMAGKTGRDALMSAADSYRAFAHQNPGIYPLIIQAKGIDAETEKVSRDILTLFLLILGSFGLEGDEALHTVRGLRSLLHGFVSLELAGGFALGLELTDSFERLLSTFIDGIEP